MVAVDLGAGSCRVSLLTWPDGSPHVEVVHRFENAPADPADAPALARLIFQSLAARYAVVLADIRQLTGRRLRRLFVVGGGSQNALLNRLTAQATGLQVHRGAVESSTLGNVAVQLAAVVDRKTDAATVARWAAALQ